MGVARMLQPWRAVLQGALPDLHGHQINGLTEASWAMIQAGDCRLSQMAVASPSQAKVPSRERRWQRLVANARLDVSLAMDHWARWVLSDARRVTLLLDETPQHNHLRAMKISRMTGGRAVPLMWWCYRPQALPMPLDQLVLDLLARTQAALPANACPTLLADRGLCWPAILDFCVDHRWHYLLRAQGQTRVKGDDGAIKRLDQLAPRPGVEFCGQAQVFKKAGWRTVNLVAGWSPSHEARWLLITDLPPCRRRCRQYAQRMRQEQSFRDEKSHGFGWNDSRIRDPDHASRLLLIMALAMAWLIRLGQRLIRRGRRSYLERRDRRTLSLFQLGLRSVHDHLQPARDPPNIKCVGW